VSYKKQPYGDRRTDNRPQYTNTQSNQPQQPKQAYVAKSAAPVQSSTPAIVPEVSQRPSLPPTTLRFLVLWRSLAPFCPIRQLRRRGRKKSVSSSSSGVFLNSWMLNDRLVVICSYCVANILIDQGLVWLHMQLTDEYYMASLGILLVLVTSLVFLDRHGYKYPVMLGVIIAALTGMYLDMISMAKGNSFMFVSAFVLVYKFVVEPAIEAVKRLFAPKTQVVAEKAVSAPAAKSATPAPAAETPVSKLMPYDEAVKVIKIKVAGVAANWREYRDALVATFHAKFPEYEVETILQELAMAIKDWEGGTFDDLLVSYGITENITRPKLPESAQQKQVETNPLLKFLDLTMSTDRVLKLVKDWPNAISAQVVEDRRTALRAIVEKYAELAEERPQDVMVKFSSPTFVKYGWNFT
jgi:hypothetical protein